MLWSRPRVPLHSFARSRVPSCVGPFESLGESVVTSLDSFKSRKTLTVGGKAYDYFSLKAAEKAGLGDLTRLPTSLSCSSANR